MRHVLMFVAGFAVVAVTGVAMAQTGLLASETTESDDWSTYATQTVDLPKVESSEAKLASETKTEAEIKSVDASKTESSEVAKLSFEILSPSDGTRVEVAEATFTGTVTPDAYVWSGEHEATVKEDGSWTLTVPLQPGKNRIHIGAKIDKQSKTLERVVYLGEPLVWSITQKVKASETPYEKFYGTGSPGMKITATSPHGSASTTIDKSGEWVLGVSFKSTPGSTFAVTVSTSTGWTNSYSFSHLGTKTTKTSDTEWKIAHKYAENSEPWTKFYGTGPVGTVVKATSDHGYGEVKIGKHGDWYLQVHFDVPAGTVVAVRVTNSLGFDQTYQFVWKSYELAVQQKFGSSSADPVYEVFWGTAAPNSWVKINSAYGWTKVPTSKTGTFEATLFFENAPFDVAFEVEVYDASGNRKTFMFTRLGS
jgi:hypothetical protein